MAQFVPFSCQPFRVVLVELYIRDIYIGRELISCKTKEVGEISSITYRHTQNRFSSFVGDFRSVLRGNEQWKKNSIRKPTISTDNESENMVHYNERRFVYMYVWFETFKRDVRRLHLTFTHCNSRFCETAQRDSNGLAQKSPNSPKKNNKTNPSLSLAISPYYCWRCNHRCTSPNMKRTGGKKEMPALHNFFKPWNKNPKEMIWSSAQFY